MPTTTGKATDLITFSRGSLATVTDADGKIKWAPHNLLSASEQFDASAWSKGTGATVSANYAVSPNGTTTADRLLETNTNDTHSVYRLDIALAAAAYTWGIFAKAGERNWLAIEPYDGTSYSTYFNLSTGAVGTSSAGNTANIASVGNGWYLCTVTRTMSATASGGVGFRVTTGDGVGAYTGDPTKGILIWGASLTRADLGGMQANASAYPYYNPSTPKNLLGYSEAFTDSWWTKLSVTATAQAASGPTGMGSATLVYPSSSGTDRLVYRASALTGVASTPYTISVYAKASGINFIYFGTLGGGTTASLCAFFDLSNGTKTQTGTYFTSATITPIGSGWYRCTATAPSALTSLFPIVGVADANNNTTVTASGTNGVLLWGAQLSDSASLDPYVPSFGAAPSAAAAHGARLDYDPVTLAAKGLLVEETRQNLLSYSSEMDNSGVWARNTSRTTTAANQIAAPDGTVTATKITTISASSSGTYLARVSGISTSAGAFCVSVYAKKGTSNGWIALQAGDGTNYYTAWYNLNTGVKGGTSTTGTDFTAKNHDIVNVGGGWYRIWITITRTTTAAFSAYVYTDCSADQSYQSTLNNFDYAWGGQVEAATFPTSFIQTIGNQTVTRNADVASVGVSQFPYSASEGTLVWNYSSFGSATSGGRVVALGLGGSNSYGIFPLVVSSTQNQIYIRDISGDAINGVIYTANQTTNKGAAAYKVNDFAVASNGTIAATSSLGAVPSQTDMLRLGRAINTDGAYLNGHIRQITYIPRRLSNAELQSRSA